MRIVAGLLVVSVLATPLRAQNVCAPEILTGGDSAWRAWSAKTLAQRDTSLMLGGGFDVRGDSAIIPPIPLTPVHDDAICRRIIAAVEPVHPERPLPYGAVQVLSAGGRAFTARGAGKVTWVLLDGALNVTYIYRDLPFDSTRHARPQSSRATKQRPRRPPSPTAGLDWHRRLVNRMGVTYFDLTNMPDAGYLTVYRNGHPLVYRAFVLEIVSEPDTGFGHPCARRAPYRRLIAWRGEDTLPEGLLIRGLDFTAPLGPYEECDDQDPPAAWNPPPSLLMFPSRWSDTTWGAIGGTAHISIGEPGRPCRAMPPQRHWQLDFELRARCSETEHEVEFDSRIVPIEVGRMVPTGPWVPIDTVRQSLRAPRQRLPGRRWTVRCDDPTLAGQNARWQCGEPRPWMFETLRRARAEVAALPPSPPPPPPTIRVIGVIRDSATGAPVPGVIVRWGFGLAARADSGGRFVSPRVVHYGGNFTVLCQQPRPWHVEPLARVGIPGDARGLVAREVLVDARRCVEPPPDNLVTTFEGHYSMGFEESGFVPCPGTMERIGHPDAHYIWLTQPFSSPDSTVRSWPTQDTTGYRARWFVRVRGRLYGPGSYGHLGGADYLLEVTRVLVARTPGPSDCQAH